MIPKSTTEIITKAIEFALNDPATRAQIDKRDNSKLFLNSINTAIVTDPQKPSPYYAIKISFDYSPPVPAPEDLIVWVGFNSNGTFRFLGGKQQ